MNVLDTSSHGDRPMCQIWYANDKANRSNRSGMKTCKKPYKFDLKVKVQGCIWIMNVRDTSYHGDTITCQIWLANVNPKKSYGSDTNLHRQTDRHDRQTDRQSDSYIPP